ncbi:regulatory protein RecX [Psychromonas ossibalaenae]|uniref:regulatory protein RecX n=1 Tax=Psychromonas ossibalaenae TaxID=444922 RepID=UPI000525E425|nr:regulatory protein RecX [Psychromonas ossibalaenae]
MSFNKPIKPAEDIDSVRRSAFWHLGRRDHSEKELREKIARKTDNQQWIETVINECLENNYLNDNRFVENFIRSAQNKGFGINRIKRDLQRKGIDAGDLANTFESSVYDYVNGAVTLLSGKYNKRLANQHLKQKAMAFLQGKGHDFNDIFSAIEIHNEAYPEEERVDINEAAQLLFRKFKTEIVERKQHDKAMRFLLSRGYTFSDAQDAVKEFNKQMHESDQ